MSKLHKSKKLDLVDKFNDTSRYLDDILTIDNPKASVTIVDGFCPEFHPPFLWRSKHQTKMTVHINNLVPS